MAKRSTRSSKNLFDFDLESIFDLSQEEKSDFQALSDSSANPKKLKSNDDKAMTFTDEKENFFKLEDINMEVEPEEGNDFSKFFENLGNDNSKSIQGRKAKLNQFADSLISLYEAKISEMLNKMDDEVDALKDRASNLIQEELNKFDEEFNSLMVQENTLIKILEQQIKLVQKTAQFQQHWSESLAKIHNEFFQEYKELKNKHKNEASELKKALESDVVALQNQFICETKKEEMKTIKSYINIYKQLNNIYF